MKTYTINNSFVSLIHLFFNDSWNSLPLVDTTQIDWRTVITDFLIYVIDSATPGEVNKIYKASVDWSGNITYTLVRTLWANEHMMAIYGAVYIGTVYPLWDLRNQIDASRLSQKTVISPDNDIFISYTNNPWADELLPVLAWQYLSLFMPMNTPVWIKGTIGDKISIYNNVDVIVPAVSLH